MGRKYLVAVDGSQHGWKALSVASELAKQMRAELLILHVVPYERLPDALKEFASVENIPVEEASARYHLDREIGDAITREAEARARGRDVEKVTARVAEGNPVEKILELAQAEGVSMIIVGSRGLSDASSLLMGSVSHKVVHLAPCTCLAVK